MTSPELDPAWTRFVAAAPADGNVYITDNDNNRVQYFTSGGSYLGEWGAYGSAEGEFHSPRGLAFAPDGGVLYVADGYNGRIQYFTPTGSYLGRIGEFGQGNGQFNYCSDVDFTAGGERLYVADAYNTRMQYFYNDTAVAPSSWGRVKAFFR